MNKEEKTALFKAKVDDAEREFMVKLPDVEQQREGQKEYNRAFKDAIGSGCLLRAKLDDFMNEQKLWDDAKQESMVRLQKDIMHKEQALAKGGIKLGDARQIALELKKLRAEMKDLISERMELDVHTAEGQADNARFNYWVSCCLVYNDTKKRVFTSVDEYLNAGAKEYANKAASKLAEMLYNLNSDFESTLEENMFLKEFGFVDDKGRLINKEGKLINEEGKLIDDQGWFIDENGNRIDSEGNPLDEKGNYKFDKKPFLDDDGNPILVDTKNESIEAVETIKTTENIEESVKAE